jgi:hypothetical protein
VSEAKQGRHWLVLGWDKVFQRRLLTGKQFEDKVGNAVAGRIMGQQETRLKPRWLEERKIY